MAGTIPDISLSDSKSTASVATAHRPKWICRPARAAQIPCVPGTTRAPPRPPASPRFVESAPHPTAQQNALRPRAAALRFQLVRIADQGTPLSWNRRAAESEADSEADGKPPAPLLTRLPRRLPPAQSRSARTRRLAKSYRSPRSSEPLRPPCKDFSSPSPRPANASAAAQLR